MGNCHDPKNPTTLDNVYQALRSERSYQHRRWGCRQPDGRITEVRHSVEDFVIYARSYYNEAMNRYARQDGIADTLDALRKVAGLAMAAIEQHCDLVTLTKLATWRQLGCLVPMFFEPNMGHYLLKIDRLIREAEDQMVAFNPDGALNIFHLLLRVSVECFEQFGVQPRHDGTVMNARDGQPT